MKSYAILISLALLTHGAVAQQTGSPFSTTEDPSVLGSLMSHKPRYTREMVLGNILKGALENMHFTGKEIRIWHQPKVSKERKLIFDLRNWDYNWQSSYYTKEYYFLNKGDTLHVEAIYDNSSRNPTNPFSPPRTLFLGENDEDEMGYVSVSYMSPRRPDGHNEFLNYFVKLREGALLKKAFEKK